MTQQHTAPITRKTAAAPPIIIKNSRSSSLLLSSSDFELVVGELADWSFVLFEEVSELLSDVGLVSGTV